VALNDSEQQIDEQKLFRCLSIRRNDCSLCNTVHERSEDELVEVSDQAPRLGGYGEHQDTDSFGWMSCVAENDERSLSGTIDDPDDNGGLSTACGPRLLHGMQFSS
jgi:hypothetical protein